MEKKRKSKVMIIIVLCFCVLFLSVGFSAFSTKLTVVSGADVNPSADTFNVDFSTSSSGVVSGNIVPTTSSTDVVATNAKIKNDSTDSIITNIAVTFTEPGQSATYSFYAYNNGKYVAYLKKISFLNVLGKSSSKICTSIPGTTESMVTAACAGITLSVSVGNKSISNMESSQITGHSLAKNTGENVVITIAYTGTAETDGDFLIEFGDISLEYSTVD